jgi:SIR2-like domain
VLPPLDADFFQQAQRLDEQTFTGSVRQVIDFVRDEYGTTRLPTLEALFTQLQGYEQFLEQFYNKRGRRPERYKRQLEYLLELIPLVFRAAFEDQRCTWHDRIAHALRKGDAVVSFNYDTVIDEALSRLADGIWKADRGYGFKIVDGTTEWSAASKPGAFPRKEYLRLLKPHGSLHWVDVDPSEKKLRLESDAYGQPTARGSIIPPTWDKTILGDWPWKPVWQEASTFLQGTRCLIVIGYSVPQTDLTTQALIRSSLSGSRLRLIVVANPDPVARAKVIDLARGGITSSTRILELESIRDFARLLDETPDERTKRQATRRELRNLDRKVRSIEFITDDLEWHDLDDFDDRISSVEDFEGRISELESGLESLAAEVSSSPD